MIDFPRYKEGEVVPAGVVDIRTELARKKFDNVKSLTDIDDYKFMSLGLVLMCFHQDPARVLVETGAVEPDRLFTIHLEEPLWRIKGEFYAQSFLLHAVAKPDWERVVELIKSNSYVDMEKNIYSELYTKTLTVMDPVALANGLGSKLDVLFVLPTANISKHVPQVNGTVVDILIEDPDPEVVKTGTNIFKQLGGQT